MYQKRTKRQQQKEDTRAKVYTCARRLFTEKGFDNVTVEEIAAEAGVSVGAIYFHFKSKPEIMANYHEDLDHAYVEYFSQPQRKTDGRDYISRLVDFILFACKTSADLGIDNIRVVYPYMMCNAEFGSRMLNTERPYYKFLYALVLGGQKNGEIRMDMDADTILSDLTLLTRGCIMDWCIHGGGEDIRLKGARLLDTYVNGMRPQPAPPNGGQPTTAAGQPG